MSLRKEDRRRLKQVEDAINISKLAHVGVEYRPTMPYIVHCQRVATSVATFGYLFEIVGYLHDTLEAGKITLSDATSYFGSQVGDALDAITRLPGEHYSVYIGRVKANPIARIVKIADLEENLLWGAGEKLPEKGCTLRPRYLSALSDLLE